MYVCIIGHPSLIGRAIYTTIRTIDTKRTRRIVREVRVFRKLHTKSGTNGSTNITLKGIIMYTKHAKEQMSARKISHDNIMKALSNGHVMINKNKPTNRTIICNEQSLYVVTNDIKTVVITAFWRK